MANEPVKIAISLRGANDDLQRAHLSTLRANVLQDGIAISTPELVEAKAEPRIRRLSAEFRAPAKAGSYILQWMLPGIRSLESIFAVIEP
jgi:hypothetical protein